MAKIKLISTWHLVCILPLFFLVGCGYDTALQYKTEASEHFELKITSITSHQQASDVIKQTFKQEGLTLTPFANNTIVESYYTRHSDSQTNITLYKSPELNRVIVAIYPARLNSISSKRRAQLKKREEVILRIERKLKQTNSFSEYISTAAQGKNE